MRSLLVLLGTSLAAVPGELKTDIEFAKPGGHSLTLDAFVPEGKGPFPAVIVVHGGGWEAGDKQTYVPPLFEPLSKAGFVWFTINYRLVPQYMYPAPVEDVEAAVTWVRKNAKAYKVDTKKIVLAGESAGGHLVALVGAQNKPPSRVNAVVCFYGVTDVARFEQVRQEPLRNITRLFGTAKRDEAAMKLFREGSAVAYIDKKMPPFLFIHGTEDKSVPYDQSTVMCGRMKAAGARCEVLTVEGAGHGIGGWEKEPRFQAYKTKMVDWINSTLQ